MFLAMLLWECSGVCETRFYLRNIYIVAHGGEEINCASDESNCLEGSSYLLDCYIKWGGRWAWGRIHYLQAYQNKTNTFNKYTFPCLWPQLWAWPLSFIMSQILFSPSHKVAQRNNCSQKESLSVCGKERFDIWHIL